MKQIFITNGMARSGKDTFVEILNQHIPTVKYSSIDIIKEIATLGGYKGGKDVKDRKFLSDLKVLFTEYNDLPFNDISKMVEDFNTDGLEGDILLIDIREPDEIERAKVLFDAKTVLIVNKNVPMITSNMADANVYKYKYDYVITNNGTYEDFERKVKEFYDDEILPLRKDDK